jgi:hypothetical protein
MSRATAIAALAAGVALGLVSGLADALGIGAEPGFGWKQQLGMAAAAALVVVGAVGLGLARRRA